MNRILLVSFLCLSPLLLESQEAVDIQTQNELPTEMDGIPLNTNYEPLKPKKNSPNKDGGPETIFLGTSGNIYTILLEGNNQVSYNPVLDAVTFIHRKEDAAPLNGVVFYGLQKEARILMRPIFSEMALHLIQKRNLGGIYSK